MKLDLAVLGQGAVTPAGLGVKALLHGEPKPVPIASIRRPEKTWPVLRVDQKDPALARWLREPRLRRASPITFFLVEAAEQALAGVPREDRAATGLIVAFSAGCLAYSRRFYEGIVKQGQKTASPALFPETVFNSPVSHVATVLGLNGAAYSLVGDESAWGAALQTAATWLKLGRVRQALVLGVEEFDPLVLEAYACSRWLRGGFLTSEGAAGILVRMATSEDSHVIAEARDGLIYRTRKEASAAAEKLLSEIDNPIFPTTQHNWLGPLENKTFGQRPRVINSSPYLGEAITASAAWNTIRAWNALDAATPRIALPLWGVNHQFGCLALENRK